jgi:DNA invertase Pin-like site-specific DNA recombinase
LIRSRTSEGRERAKARGVKMGRPPKLDTFQKGEAVKQLKAGESPAAIGPTYGVHRSTIERIGA